MDDVEMDKLFGRDRFEEWARGMGWAEERIGGEWLEFRVMLEKAIIEIVYGALSYEERGGLEEGLDIYNEADGHKDLRPFVERIVKFLKENPGRVDLKKALADASKIAQERYMKKVGDGGGRDG